MSGNEHFLTLKGLLQINARLWIFPWRSQNSDFKSKFSKSEIIWILPFFFIKEYKIRSTTYVNDIYFTVILAGSVRVKLRLHAALQAYHLKSDHFPAWWSPLMTFQKIEYLEPKNQTKCSSSEWNIPRRTWNFQSYWSFVEFLKSLDHPSFWRKLKMIPHAYPHFRLVDVWLYIARSSDSIH